MWGPPLVGEVRIPHATWCSQKKKKESMKTTELFPLPPPPHRLLGDRPPGFRIATTECCLPGRLSALDGGHLSRWVQTALCVIVSVFSSSYFCPSFCGWASNSVTETVAPLGEACSRIIAGSREPREHPCLGAGWRALAAQAGGMMGTGGRGGQRCTGCQGWGRGREGRGERPASRRFRVALGLHGPSSRPALRAPLLVDRHHLVPPDHSRLPP